MKKQYIDSPAGETHVFIQVNNTCNQKCVFCNRPPDLSSKHYNETEDIKNRIKEFSNNKDISTIVFTGGETLLFPKLSEVVKFAKEYHFKTEVQTNGTLLHIQINELKKAGLDKINFALHSHIKNISNKIRGTELGFEKINENILLAKKMGFEIHIVHVVNSLNYKDLPEFVDYLNLQRLNEVRINFSLVVPECWAWENKWIIPRYKKLKPFLLKAMKKCDEYKIQFDISEIVPLCIVDGFEEHAVSTMFKIADIKIIDDYLTGLRNLDFINPSNEHASKAPQCQECKLNSICAGFYPRVKELYGVTDFIPFKGDISQKLKRIFPNEANN